jgi:hypothetical protein
VTRTGGDTLSTAVWMTRGSSPLITMTPIGARRRQPRPPGQNAPLKIMKGLLQYRQDAHGEDLAQGLIVGDDNETSVTKSCLSVPSDLARWLAPEVLYPSLRPEVEDGEGFQASKTVTCERDAYAFAMAS